MSQEHEFKAQMRVDCEAISDHSILLLTTNDMSEGNSDPCYIDFSWSTDTGKSTFRSFLLKEELLRDLNVIGKSLEELRSEVKAELEREKS